MAFSASEAAFEGFRIIRREPVTVVIWAIVLMVFSFAAVAAMLPFMRSAMGGFGVTPGAQANPAAVAAMMGQLGQMYLIGAPLYLLVMSVFNAAVYRAVLRPQETGMGRLRLGGDELRLVGVYLLVGLLFLAVSIAIILIAAIVGVGLAAAFRQAPAAAAFAILLLYLVVMAAFAWVAVRLSFAAPMTFARKRIHLFSSWRLTRGRFWPLLGCYLLAMAFVILVGLVDLAVSGVLAIGMSGGSVSRAATGLLQPNYASLGSLLTPLYIARVVVGGIFGVIIWTVMSAAPAAAFREIAGPKPEDQAAAFS